MEIAAQQEHYAVVYELTFPLVTTVAKLLQTELIFKTDRDYVEAPKAVDTVVAPNPRNEPA